MDQTNLCNLNRYMKMEVPLDCKEGDLIEYDLRDAPTQQENEAVDSSKNLKECARLFLKYGGGDSYKISLRVLETILESEFRFVE